MEERRFYLPPEKMPTAWYNVLADLPTPPAPYLHPITHEPLTPDFLTSILPVAILEQEMSSQRWIDIPGEILDLLTQYRPSPLHRAVRLEQALGTPARIYYKNESVSPTGAHKTNAAIAGVYYNKKAGTKRLTTDTGAGQWGSALSLACHWFGLDCTIYMVRVSYEQKPYRRTMMRMWGAEVLPSPSTRTQTGRDILAKDPDCIGALGIAVSEAVEDARANPDVCVSNGSVLNHVLMYQTVIGLECLEQFAMIGDDPDVVIGCVGGGSNFGGLMLPFLGRQLRGEAKKPVRFLAAEPAACPSFTRGTFAYDFCDSNGLIPMAKMYTLGHTFVPPGIHAGGLRYHGDSPLLSHLRSEGRIDAEAYGQLSVFEAGDLFVKTEGFLPAPESCHAIRAAINEAMQAKEEGEERVILFGLSGHGFLDLASYEAHVDGALADSIARDEEIRKSLADIPAVDEVAQAA